MADQYQAMYERHLFLGRMTGLIVRYWQEEKKKIAPDDPDAEEKREAINEKCIAEVQTLRRHFFGRKWAPMCQFCNYYSFWEKNGWKKRDRILRLDQ